MSEEQHRSCSFCRPVCVPGLNFMISWSTSPKLRQLGSGEQKGLLGEVGASCAVKSMCHTKWGISREPKKK